LIWVFLPAVASVVFWFYRRQFGRVILLADALCFVLSVLALTVPIGEQVQIGPLAFQINPDLAFAGRRLVLENVDRAFLVFVYAMCIFWFTGSYAVKPNPLLIPFGLGLVTLLVAALAVEPFLYAALLVEMAVLLAVPMLALPERTMGQGVLRFLIFQTLAMPFILLAGWALAGVDANPSNLVLVQLATAFLGLGFAFWLAVFPFYTWIPLLAEQSYPYAAGFVFLALLTVNLLLFQAFLDRFGWLASTPGVLQAIGMVGTLMVVTAGILAAFQKDLARLFGYAVIVETGFSLLATSLGSRVGQELFASMFIPRMVSFGLWAVALSIFRQEAHTTRFEDVWGISQKLPLASAGLALASLTLAGLPLLAVFPIRLVLMEELARQSLFTALWVLAGTVGMLFSTFRALTVLIRGRSLPQAFAETRFQSAILVGGIAGLILVGIFPQVFLPLARGLLSAYAPLP
jgi:formate hydrogenlyase subunit 3/multisubunit Na+/H+ antiporter MnhD subunit